MIPINLALASINESIKFAHVASKMTFLRFSRKGGYMFDTSTEIRLDTTLPFRAQKIIEYKKP